MMKIEHIFLCCHLMVVLSLTLWWFFLTMQSKLQVVKRYLFNGFISTTSTMQNMGFHLDLLRLVWPEIKWLHPFLLTLSFLTVSIFLLGSMSLTIVLTLLANVLLAGNEIKIELTIFTHTYTHTHTSYEKWKITRLENILF